YQSVYGKRGLVYGFWEPMGGATPFGPFINHNHFAGWATMLIALAFAHSCAVVEASGRKGVRWTGWLIWLTRPEASRAALMVLAVVAMGTGLVLTESRGGVACFAVAMAVMGYFIVGQTNKKAARWLAAATVIALIAGAVAWGGLDKTVARFARAS